jgi:hypothetical protein
MLATSDTPSVASPRRWFYGAAVVLMLIGVATAVVQKARESAVAQTGARRAAAGLPVTKASQAEVQQIIREAHRWADVSLAAVFFAMVSWRVAVSRREKRCGANVVVVCLLALYVMLQLMMV